MSVYLSNAFSLQMQGEYSCITHPCTLEDARELVTNRVYSELVAKSCVGHADMAAILSAFIGVDVPVNRISVALQPGDTLVVGQYVGPRLPEGCSTLPEGARIRWYIVECRERRSLSVS